MRPYDLLLGLLASQLRLVSRGSLASFAQHSAAHPDARLPEFLSDHRGLSEADHTLLLRIVDSIIHAHHGEVEAALETFGGPDAAQSMFTGPIRTPGFDPASSDAETVLAEELPHGLPHQVTPETIGRYTGGSEYARGGIGRILLVHDEQIGRDIILKELLPERLVSPTDSTLSKLPTPDSPGSPMRHSAAMMARFLQEAKITGQLEHPSIVPVYELGLRTDGQLYYTMKLVRGETLAASIRDCKTLDDRLGLLRSYLDICQAMAYAHSKHVIHRDLKPSNIMVGEFGECVVLDWGLAKVKKDVDAHREAMEKTISQLELDPAHLDGLNTRSKDVMGTPLYMSPEQARGEIETVGVHSDVYSLGVILYEILTGELPHPWTNTLDTVRRVAAVPAPSVLKAAPQTPPELAAICDKALQFEAQDRYPSARELEKDIEHFLAGAVVEAYSYSAADTLRRLYQRHKTLIRTVGVATVTIVVIGVVSFVSIYRARIVAEEARDDALVQQKYAEEKEQEAQTQRLAADEARQRAESAEVRTAREKYVSDIRLADAYLRDFKFQAAEDTLLATDPAYRAFEWGYLMAQCHQDLATLGGHTNNVFRLEFSPDGESLLTLSGDRSARLWDFSSRALLQQWAFPSTQALYGAFNPKGTLLAFCLDTGQVMLVDPESGEERTRLSAHTAAANYCVFSEDGDTLFTCGNDRRAIRWNLDNGNQSGELPIHDSPIVKIEYIAFGARLLTESTDGLLRLFDAITLEPLASASGMNFSYVNEPDLVAAADGTDAVLYRGSDLHELERLPHGGRVGYVRIYPAAEVVVTTCDDGNARIFSFPDGELKKVLSLGDGVRDCLLTPNGHRLVATTYTGAGFVWDFPLGREINRFAGHRGAVLRLKLSPDSLYAITGSMDTTARIWPLEHALIRTDLGHHDNTPTNFTVARDVNRIAITTEDGTITVDDIDTRRRVYDGRFLNISGSTGVSLSPDGKILGLVVDEFMPLIISLDDGTVLSRLKGHHGTINSIQFNADATQVATTSWDKAVKVWRVVDGTLEIEFTAHTESTTFATFSPDGKWLASTSNDNTARIWNLESSEEMLRIAHQDDVVHCAFSNDGLYFASVSEDGTAQLWDLASKSLLGTLEASSLHFDHAEFDKSDSRLLLSSADGSIRLLNVSSLSTLLDLRIDSGVPMGARFGTQEDTMYFLTDDGTFGAMLSLPQALEDPAQAINYRDAWRARMDMANHPTPLVSVAHRFLPQPDFTALLEALTEGIDAGDTGSAVGQSTLQMPAARQLQLQDGDALLAVNEIPVASLRPEDTVSWGGPLDPAGTSVYLEILRNSRPLRFVCHVIPVETDVAARNIPPSQGSALLMEGMKVLSRGEAEVLYVNRKAARKLGFPLAEPDSISGYWINYFPNPIGDAMLQASGLHSGARITHINGIPVTSIHQLQEQLNAAKTTIERDGRGVANVRIQEGQFRQTTLTYQLGEAP